MIFMHYTYYDAYIIEFFTKNGTFLHLIKSENVKSKWYYKIFLPKSCKIYNLK